MEDVSAQIGSALGSGGMQVIEWRTSIEESGTRRRIVLRHIAEGVDAVLAENAAAAVPQDTTATGRHAVMEDALAWRLLADGEGPAVMLLHGFTRSSVSWEPLVAQLAGYRIFGVDLMGHGASPAPGPAARLDAYRLDFAADAVADLVGRLGIGPAHLAGYSLGGRTALHAALRHPELWRTLALISANPGIEDDDARTARREADAALAERIGATGLEAFVGDWEAGPLFAALKQNDFAAWEEAHRDRLRRCCRGLQGSLLGSGQGAQRSLWPELAQLDLPMLVAAGSEDGKYGDIARRLAAAVPGATLQVYEGAGHDLLTERPEEIAAALATLWKR